MNFLIWIIGALPGGWLLAPLFGTGTINQNELSLSALPISFLGAVLLMMIVNLLQRA